MSLYFFITIFLALFILFRSLDLDDDYGALSSVIVFILLMIGAIIWSLNEDYKQGQIDALSGNIKYKLVEQPDGTKEWVEIPKSEPKQARDTVYVIQPIIQTIKDTCLTKTNEQ